MNNETILFVDDEPNVLQSLQRQLRKRFTVKTAGGGDEALELLHDEGPCAVIVSDMRMPGMDGVQLLSRVKDLYPDMVRMMLTGNADQETAMEAVNTGQIFRFLTKPCPTPMLITSLALALRQYRLLTAEHELLNETLKGSVKVLSELLSLSNAVAFSSSYRIKATILQIVENLKLRNSWQYEIAALMSQIGCVTLPHEILHKLQAGEELTEEESETYCNHPHVGSRLVAQIPRLEKVAGMIDNQLRAFDDFKSVAGELDDDVQLGAQILRAVNDYDLLLHRGVSNKKALEKLERASGQYNPEILSLLGSIQIKKPETQVKSVMFQDLVAGMFVEDDVVAKNGALIIPKGQEITWSTLQGLQNFLKHIGIQEPIRVRVGKDG